MSDRRDDSGSDSAVQGSGMDPADAFALLGDPTRLAIVSELHDAGGKSPLPFSVLYDRVDVDDTGKFNYHRDQLVPHFVTRSDEGYELTEAGRRIARAVAAGTYTDTPRLDPFAIDGSCYACGVTALRASYRDERFAVECGDCGEPILEIAVPPSVVRGRDPPAVADAVDRWSFAQVEAAVRGLCPSCGGPVERSVTEDVHEDIAFEILACFDCTVCGRRAMTSFGALAYRTRTVERFHRRRGEAVRDRPYWVVPQCVSGDHVRIVSRDPWRVGATFHADGDACRVELDGDFDVVETAVGGAGSGAGVTGDDA